MGTASWTRTYSRLTDEERETLVDGIAAGKELEAVEHILQGRLEAFRDNVRSVLADATTEILITAGYSEHRMVSADLIEEALAMSAAPSSTIADRVEAMCDWTASFGETKKSWTHEAFHFGNECPYRVVAELLRGNPDPRRHQGDI